MSGASPREVKAGMGKRKTAEKCGCHAKSTGDDIMPTTIKQQPAITCRSGQQDFLERSL